MPKKWPGTSRAVVKKREKLRKVALSNRVGGLRERFLKEPRFFEQSIAFSAVENTSLV